MSGDINILKRLLPSNQQIRTIKGIENDTPAYNFSCVFMSSIYAIPAVVWIMNFRKFIPARIVKCILGHVRMQSMQNNTTINTYDAFYSFFVIVHPQSPIPKNQWGCWSGQIVLGVVQSRDEKCVRWYSERPRSYWHGHGMWWSMWW